MWRRLKERDESLGEACLSSWDAGLGMNMLRALTQSDVMREGKVSLGYHSQFEVSLGSKSHQNKKKIKTGWGSY